MKRFVARILKILVLLVILLVAAPLVWASYYVDTQSFRDDLTSILTSVTGREVKLRGDVDVTLYPWLGISVHGLSVANEPGFPGESMVDFKTLIISARLMPLLNGKLEFGQLVADGVMLYLTRRLDGEVNWDDFKPSKSTDSNVDIQLDFSSFSVRGIDLKDVSIAMYDVTSNQRFRVDGLTLKTGPYTLGDTVAFVLGGDFRWKTRKLNVKMNLSGTFNPTPGKLTISRDSSLNAVISGEGMPKALPMLEVSSNMKLNLEKGVLALHGLRAHAGELEIAGQVRATNLYEKWRADGVLAINPFNLKKLLLRHNPEGEIKTIKGFESASLQTNWQLNAEELYIKKLSLGLDGMTVHGDAAISLDNKAPNKIYLSASRVDLDRYHTKSSKPDNKPLTWKAVPLDLLRSLNMNGSVKTAELVTNGKILKNVRLVFTANKGTISASGSVDNFNGSQLRGRISSKLTTGKTPQLSLMVSADMPGSDIRLLLPAKNRKGVMGKVDLAANLRAANVDCKPNSSVLASFRKASGMLSIKSKAPISFVDAKKRKRVLKRLDGQVEFRPVLKRKAAYSYDLRGKIDTGIKLHALNADVSFNGLVDLDKKLEDVRIARLATKMNVTGDILPKGESISLKARLSHGKTTNIIKIDNLLVKALGAQLAGNLELDSFTWPKGLATGRVVLSDVNIIDILKRYDISLYEMQGPKALRDLKLGAKLRLAEGKLHCSLFQSHFDGTPFGGVLVMERFPALDFSGHLRGGHLDIDDFFPKDEEVDIAKLRAGHYDHEEPAPLPLEFFKWLDINAKLHLDGLNLADIQADNVDAIIDAENGTIRLTDVHGDFYGGELTGDWTILADKTIHTRLRLIGREFEAADFLKGMLGKDYLRGNTYMSLDVSGVGLTDLAIEETLTGNSTIKISKGSYKFTGWDAPEFITGTNGKKSANPRARRTAYNKARTNVIIKDGVFTLHDMRMESTVMSVTGKGGFNLPKETIDMSLKADIGGVSSVTVTLNGRLTDPEVKIPKGKAVDDTIKKLIGLPLKPFKFLRDLFF